MSVCWFASHECFETGCLSGPFFLDGQISVYLVTIALGDYRGRISLSLDSNKLDPVIRINSEGLSSAMLIYTSGFNPEYENEDTRRMSSNDNKTPVAWFPNSRLTGCPQVYAFRLRSEVQSVKQKCHQSCTLLASSDKICTRSFENPVWPTSVTCTRIECDIISRTSYISQFG